MDGGVNCGERGDGAAELPLAADGEETILARPLLLLLLLLVPMTTVGGLLEAGRLMSSNDSSAVSVLQLIAGGDADVDGDDKRLVETGATSCCECFLA